jgi:hypothetical protein
LFPIIPCSVSISFVLHVLLLGLVMSASLVEQWLALNRCLHFVSPTLCRRLFGHKLDGWGKTGLWCLPSGVLFALCFLFAPPTIYSGYGQVGWVGREGECLQQQLKKIFIS